MAGSSWGLVCPLFKTGNRDGIRGDSRPTGAFGVLPKVWVCPLLKTGDRDGIRGGSRPPGSFVSPRVRIGRHSHRLVESESRVQDARRTSRPTGKSL